MRRCRPPAAASSLSWAAGCLPFPEPTDVVLGPSPGGAGSACLLLHGPPVAALTLVWPAAGGEHVCMVRRTVPLVRKVVVLRVVPERVLRVPIPPRLIAQLLHSNKVALRGVGLLRALPAGHSGMNVVAHELITTPASLSDSLEDWEGLGSTESKAGAVKPQNDEDTIAYGV